MPPWTPPSTAFRLPIAETTPSSGLSAVVSRSIRTSPDSRKPNPCTERTATIGSVTTIPGVVVANEPTVAPTHASDPTAATTNGARHRRSPSASRR